MLCSPATHSVEEGSASAVSFGELTDLVNTGFLPNYRLVVVNEQGTIATQAGHYEQGIVPVEPLTSQSVVSLLSFPNRSPIFWH